MSSEQKLGEDEQLQASVVPVQKMFEAVENISAATAVAATTAAAVTTATLDEDIENATQASDVVSINPLLPENVVLVGIAGPTRSGKSSLARALRENLPGKDLLNQDHYFKSAGETPDSIDFRRLKKDLRAMLKTAETEAKRSHQVQVVVAEGFLLFADPEVEELCSVRFFLEIDKAICRARRAATKRANLAAFDSSIWPSFLRYGQPIMDARRLDASKLVEQLVEETLPLVSSALRTTKVRKAVPKAAEKS